MPSCILGLHHVHNQTFAPITMRINSASLLQLDDPRSSGFCPPSHRITTILALVTSARASLAFLSLRHSWSLPQGLCTGCSPISIYRPHIP